MTSLATSHRTQLIDKLPQLQNLVKRDPEGYRDEFTTQLRHFESELQIMMLHPSSENLDQFVSMVSFLSHVATCYPKELENFPQQLMDLLMKQYAVLESSVRKSLMQSLILLRNRQLIEPIALFNVCFELFRCQDKKLRDLLYGHIISDLKRILEKGCNQKTTREFQKFLFTELQKETEHSSKIALQILIEMYRRRLWTDARPVNVID